MSWQKNLARGFSSAQEILAFLNLPPELANQEAEKLFATRVPKSFVRRMQVGNPEDPLLLQVLAKVLETSHVDGFIEDPLAEKQVNIIPGLLHKYYGRVLVTVTGACAINCRYCFRRHFPYKANNPGHDGWDKIISYIRENTTISEVILSGGDPLLATNITLRSLLGKLAQINHVHTIRVHTRLPIVLPERIDEDLINLLQHLGKRIVVVLHCNHPQELDETVLASCRALRQANCFLFNQSVLLKGINDCAEILALLSQRLFSYGVIPYYLHLLDKVSGAAHFNVELEQTQLIYRLLQQKLPGYLLPRLVYEAPGRASKTLVVAA